MGQTWVAMSVISTFYVWLDFFKSLGEFPDFDPWIPTLFKTTVRWKHDTNPGQVAGRCDSLFWFIEAPGGPPCRRWYDDVCFLWKPWRCFLPNSQRLWTWSLFQTYIVCKKHVCKQDVRNDNWGVCECPICGQTLSTIPGQSSLRVLASLGVASRNEGVTLKGWWRASKFKWLECETNHILILPAAHGSLYQYVQTYTCTQICIFFCRSLHPGNFTWLAREKHTFSIASSKIPNVSECYLATNGKRHENTNGLHKFFSNMNVSFEWG